jgi:RNA polymerase sigma-70 factor (ECF subfamily)
MHTTPASLLQRLREPDAEAAWTRFVALYTPLLYYWAQRLGLRETDAADLVQDVFSQMLREGSFAKRQGPEFTSRSRGLSRTGLSSRRA